MRGCTLVLAVLAGCAFEPQGVELDAPQPDGAELDAPDIDAPIDAPIDAAIDAPDIDAAIDAAIDAPDIDAAIDAAIDAPDIDAAIDAPIDSPPIVDIVFLPPSDENVGTGNVIINNALTIDTSPGAVLPNFGSGTSFTVATPTGGGSPIVVAHVGSFTVNSTLRVVGSRPFAVVAGGAVIVNGTIDASAVGTTIPGPNGALTDMGPGAGAIGRKATGAGVFGDTIADSGGGGASYGSLGGQGGDAICNSNCAGTIPVPGGVAGALYNQTRTRLVGGSGGGSAPDAATGCPGFDGGAGGGALLIYSAVSITVGATGVIEANGGGGGRGDDCNSGSTAGAGGGSGGQIELQAPMFTVVGAIAANGGGGGGGSDGGDGIDGAPGSDGGNTTAPATGGQGGGDDGGDGGNGAAGPTSATGGQDMGEEQNGGGGGAGAGLVTIHHQGAAPAVSSTPSASFVAY